MLDRAAPSPLHYQVRQYILQRVEAGTWPVGGRIPSEHELCGLLSVSRATVVRALTDLVGQGVLERQHGKGTFVSSPRLPHGPFELKSFTEEIADRGLRATARVLECAEEPAAPDVARQLGLAAGALVVRLRRVRYVDVRRAMGVQESHVSSALVPGLADHRGLLVGSLYHVLEDMYRIRLVRAVEAFEPMLLDPAEARLLECGLSRLAFKVERVSYDADGRAVEFVRSHMRGDRYRYTMELLRRA